MKKYLGIGVMSGTSCDGLDVSLIEFTHLSKWEYVILSAETFEYNQFYTQKLLNAHLESAESLVTLHSEFGILIGEKINLFLEQKEIHHSKVDFIASHGHTIFHNPEKSYSFQLGSGAHIAAVTQIISINDFRMSDVANGGQGAPLVPIADEELFYEYDACLNIGGFANVSFIKDNQRLAFDICAVNIVLNELTRNLGFSFDDQGKIARSGNVNQELLHQPNSLSYYKRALPKSLGREFIDETIKPLLKNYMHEMKIEDLIATFTHHAAMQIGLALNNFNCNKVLITGGGAFNNFLIEKIKAYYQRDVFIPDNMLINFKEALAFAYMGLLRITEQHNSLKSVTGASKNTISGAVYLP